MIKPRLRLPLTIGGLAFCAGAAWADPAEGSAGAGELERLRWQDRVFLVVADAGPMRVPFKQILRDSSAFSWKRRVGTAVYLGDRRYLVTTRSVVGENSIVELFNDDGAHVVARVVGADRYLDLALLETVDDLPGAEGLEALPAADTVAVGSPCMVVGNAYGMGLSASRGTLGEVALVLSEGVPVHVRRVDAPIYPGDSGCPVLDASGRFLGLVTAVSSRMGDSRGAVLEESGEVGSREACTKPVALSGLVIPAEEVDRAWKSLRDFGRVRRGFLGVTLSPTQVDVMGGVRVLAVAPGSPAEVYGIRAGDRILEFARRTVTDPHQFCAMVAAAAPHVRLDVRLVRGEHEQLVTVEMAEAVRRPGMVYFSRPGTPAPAAPPGADSAQVTPVDFTRN
jgi:serine protease Do